MAAKAGNGRGGARVGSGPKPKPIAALRRNRLMLNFTDQEMVDLRRAAKKHRPAEFARGIVLRHLARRKK
jgi:hypothetical protein